MSKTLVGGFNCLLGNPPWIAHAGRAAHRLAPHTKSFYSCVHPAFEGYPTTHGCFIGMVVKQLEDGGRLGIIVPSSVSELEGYFATRRAHDVYCDFPDELEDFGEGKFVGVTQPCMALVSRRTARGRGDAPAGAPWPMRREDLSEVERRLILRLKDWPTVPDELFAERGFQSDRALAEHFSECGQPSGRFTRPLREGTDVREFELRPPRVYADPVALGASLRSEAEYRAVEIVVRQTARFPIAARSDGVAFRNSLIAGFARADWPADAVVALLNSQFIRWLHYNRFRDARQPVMPQLKVAHLRAIPIDPGRWAAVCADLAALGRKATEAASERPRQSALSQVEAVVRAIYGLTAEECCAIDDWASRLGIKRSWGESNGEI